MNEYGLIFVKLRKTSDTWELYELQNEYYLDQETVDCVVETSPEVLLASCRGVQELQVVDRRKRAVVRVIESLSGDNVQNCIHLVEGYD